MKNGYRPVQNNKKGLLSRFKIRVPSLRWPGRTRRQGGRPNVVPVVRNRGRGKKTLQTISFCFIVLIFGCLAAFGGWRLLARSDIFSIATITVVGNSMISNQQVLDQANLHRGMNILSLDQNNLEQEIAKHPWIDKVEAEIHWPSAVKLTITEHKPVAIVHLEEEGQQGLYYIDRHGLVFSPVQKGQDMDFPVITGKLPVLGLVDEKIQPESPVQKGLEFLLLAAKGNSNLPIQDVSEIHISAKNGVIVYLVEYPFPIYLGHDQIRTRYYRLLRMLGHLYRKDQMEQVTAIRMDYEEDRALVAGLKFD